MAVIWKIQARITKFLESQYQGTGVHAKKKMHKILKFMIKCVLRRAVNTQQCRHLLTPITGNP